MKNLRKLIAVVAAAAMVLSNVVSVSAFMNFTGIRYPSCFNAYGDASSNKNTYVMVSGTNTRTLSYDSTTGAVCVIGTRSGNETSQVELRQHVLSTSGERAVTIRPRDTGTQDDGRLGSAYIKFNIPQRVESNEYHISFKAMVDDLVFQYKNEARAYMNWDGATSNSTSLLYCKDNPGSGIWTVTNVGTGEANGGVGTHTWYRYTGTIIAGNPTNELRFSARGWDAFHLDDVVVTDKYGNVVFSEDFEYGTPSSTLRTRWTYDGGGNVSYKIIPHHTAGNGTDITATDITNHVLSVASKNNGVGKYYIDVPLVPNNNYTLSYDKYNSFYYNSGKVDATVAVGMVDGAWGDMNIGSGTGHVTKTFNSGGNSRLRVVAEGWGQVYLDNIKLEDENGNIVFFEDFEDSDRELPYSTLKIGSDKKAAITTTGTATVTATVRNNYESSPFDCYFIAAVYNSADNKLEKVVFDNATLSKGTYKDFSLSVPVTSGQKMRVFWWNSMTGTISPLRKAASY